MGVRTLSQVIAEKRALRTDLPPADRDQPVEGSSGLGVRVEEAQAGGPCAGTSGPSELACRMAERNAAEYGFVQSPEWWDWFIAAQEDDYRHGRNL